MEKTGKKTLKIDKSKFNMTLAKVALSIVAESGEIERVLEKLIELNKNGLVIMEYRQTTELSQELNIKYSTFKTCIYRLADRGLIRREGYAIYLHPMISGDLGKFEIEIG